MSYGVVDVPDQISVIHVCSMRILMDRLVNATITGSDIRALNISVPAIANV